MRPYLIPLLALVLSVPVLRAGDADPPAKADALIGTWKLSSVKGPKPGPKDMSKVTLTFTKDKITVKSPGPDGKEVSRESSYKIDPKKDPKHLDITHNKRTTPGIYKIEKGELHICTAEGKDKERPKNFTDKEAMVLILKKAK